MEGGIFFEMKKIGKYIESRIELNRKMFFLRVIFL